MLLRVQSEWQRLRWLEYNKIIIRVHKRTIRRNLMDVATDRGALYGTERTHGVEEGWLDEEQAKYNGCLP